MSVFTVEIELRTRGEGQIIDVTEPVAAAVAKSKLCHGLSTIFVPGSTGAVSTLEYEPGLLQDVPATLDRLVPRDYPYAHEQRWHDGNGHSHVRAALIGPSLSVPFQDGKLLLGRWQQIVFIELDIRPRSRHLVVQLVGE